MKKSVKRILCGVLSVAMCSTIAVESVLRLQAENNVYSSNGGTSVSTSVKNVTGQFDTSKLRESFFNDSVLTAEETTPVYETRTVMVALDGDSIVDRAKGQEITQFMGSWSGEVAKSAIDSEQTAFLQALKRKGIPYTLNRSYNTVLNAVAVELNTKYVSTIKQMEGVDSVVITTKYSEPQTVESYSTGGVVTNETTVYETGIYDSSDYTQEYGKGMVVAVLDTGLDYTHSAFQSFQTPESEWTEAEKNLRWNKDTIKNKLNDPLMDLTAESRSGSLVVSDVYMSDKVPYAYDYADDDPDVYPSYSNHGTHVAGIIGGYDPAGYTDKDGNPITDKQFLGVVPDAQLVICKVFTDDLDDPDLGGAVSEDIVAALEDCVKLGVDVINMSLGSSCGFTTTNDGDDEGDMLNTVYDSVKAAGISLICAASNDYSAGYGGVYGTNLTSNPDAGTVGSPSTYAAALSVASINGQPADYMIANGETYVFFEESRDINSNAYDFVKGLNESYPANNGVFEYVAVPGVGHAADYSLTVKALFEEKPRLALVRRGDTTFQEKVEIAMKMGAIGVIVDNNVAGTIRMNLGEVKNPVPSVSISMNSGDAMRSGVTDRGYIGTIKVDETQAAGPFMSEFSSWGPTPDLRLKPEITAHGGEITSAVPGGYGEQSGTSMATPNMAGFMAIIRSYIEKNMQAELTALKAKYPTTSEAVLINRLAMQLTMSTAGTVYDQDGKPYSPRKQGAGVAKLENIVDGTSGTKAYLYTESVSNDYRPKVELGDDKDKLGIYTVTFKVRNFSDGALTFTPDYKFMTETQSTDKLTVSEQAYMLDDSSAEWTVDNVKLEKGDTITVAANSESTISVQLTMGQDDKDYIDACFENGMYVEGFIKLLSTDTDIQCDLALPFLGFYGDWSAAPMLDYSAYEIAENEQDASVLDEDKIKASVWATQPYNIYYNNKYVLPMGGYLYLLPDDAEPMYVDEEHNAVSRYNEYYGEGVAENYLTTTGIKAVYAGLLRNARYVRYQMIDEATGEVLFTEVINRVSKAYSGGGSAVPANVKLEMDAIENGWVGNSRYKMKFEFFNESYAGMTKDEVLAAELKNPDDTFEFSFTVDYEAPVLEDARVRFYNYKDGNNKDKQSVFLDIDVYDNHYAQTLMVCYPKTDADGDVTLQIATEYPTPIRDSVKNGVTTVSVDITDIYESYGDQLYVQIDDYALNTCLYQVNINRANANMLPEGKDFGLAEGEEKINLDIYGTHKVQILFGENYQGEGDASNFLWTSAKPKIAEVKNGEIVGFSEGTTKIFVSNRKGAVETIEVTVSDKKSSELVKIPSISFEAIKTDTDSLQKPDGNISVSAGDEFSMKILTDPWYHPMTDLTIRWSSSDPSVATVDQNGVVRTIKEGSTNISATVMYNGEETLYVAMSNMYVESEFSVSSYTLNKYEGPGYTVEDVYNKQGELVFEADGETLFIPTDLNVMYIGEEAFKDNSNIKRIIIPASVVDIRPRAFYNCTALEEVYFVSEEAQPIPDADVSMIYEQAFYGCTNLKKIDFSNTKTVTVAQYCFAGCTNLTEVVDMPSIGTMHHYAFAGTGLKSVDLSGLHMSGNGVFEGCLSLTEIAETSKFTAIGAYMFSGCLNLRNEITLKTPKIGVGAFSGCNNLAGVKFDAAGAEVEFDIGAKAFENCGSAIKGNFTVDFGTEKIRSIGERAFAGSSLKTVGAINGLEVLGSNAFANTKVEKLALGDGFDIANIRLTGIPFDGLTVTVDANATKYKEIGGVIYDAEEKTILYVNASVTGEFTLPATVTAIGDYAFAGSKVSKVTLVSGVNKLGVGAFTNAKLTAIDFNGASLEEIPNEAFKGSSLMNVVLPASVLRVGDSAFADSALSSFEGEGLQSIGNGAFSGCTALVGVATGVDGVKQLKLADGIKEMGSRVFSGCTSLTNVVLPSVEKLGSYTFSGAKSLNEVVFGANATTTGEYTFAGTPVTKVTLGSVTRIERGAFSNCMELVSILLPVGVTTVEDRAFYGCTALTTVTNIEDVVTFGAEAFYRTALTELNLESAQNIGYKAFATADGDAPTYTTLHIPSAVIIEDFAFSNGGASKISLPASLTKVGAGVFAQSKSLTELTVAEDNEYFFVEGNVLYRYTNKEAGEYELISYPTARLGEGEKGARSYAVKEGTTRVQAYAFYGLNKDMLNAVVLPYSVNAIGDSAFFNSGVTDYTFESIEAPVLETIYREEVRNEMNKDATIAEYKGYYNANFQTYLYQFTKYGTQVSNLSMTYPSNGNGYDNPVYTAYFGRRTKTAVDLQEDGTRTFLQMLDKMPTADEIKTWKDWDVEDADNLKKIEEFSNTLKSARLYYNNAMLSEGQAAYITAEKQARLLAIEEEFRAVKKAFNIELIIDELVVSESSTHKSEYLVGEKFDMTGLIITVVYDDYSTEEADASKLQLITSGELKKLNQYVEVRYEGERVRVPVKVVENVPVSDSSNSNGEEDGESDGVNPVVVILLCVVVAGGAGGGVATVLIRKKRKLTAGGVASPVEEQTEAGEPAEEVPEATEEKEELFVEEGEVETIEVEAPADEDENN